MGSPPYKCVCCSRPGAVTVQTCDGGCNGRACVKHIRFVRGKWLCSKCERVQAKVVQKNLAMRNSG